ncbi:Mut7-C RNAse domain-containing protein [bacterium]|nr:Mut7-C RNAse domain-containing protein [bacterium]
MKSANGRFVADVMLGRLARWLRLLGCDVFYDRHGEDSSLLARALSEERILLTRDNELASRARGNGYLVKSQDIREQIGELLLRFHIEPVLYGDRCPECNGLVVDVPKESVAGEVPSYTFSTHERFRRCSDCGRIYWDGSHRDLALDELKAILSSLKRKKDEDK